MGKHFSDWKHIPYYIGRCLFVLVFLFGCISLWDVIVGDGEIPSFSILLSEKLDPEKVSSPRCMLLSATTDERWEGLQPTLQILDIVNPEVAKWTREKWRAGKLVFTEGYKEGVETSNHLAKYSSFNRTLKVSRGIFAEKDGTVATILCHEYRHSRQNMGKVFMYAVSYFCNTTGRKSIVENDAYLYECEAQKAIFGRLTHDLDE